MSHESHRVQTTTWLTPPWIFDWLGNFDLDPATCENHPWPCARENRTANGLDSPWNGRVFLNPPFTNGQIETFVERMAYHQNGVLVVAARVETEWFQRFVFGAAEAIWFPRGRIQYHRQNGELSKQVGFPSIIAFYEKPPSSAPRMGTWWHSANRIIPSTGIIGRQLSILEGA